VVNTRPKASATMLAAPWPAKSLPDVLTVDIDGENSAPQTVEHDGAAVDHDHVVGAVQPALDGGHHVVVLDDTDAFALPQADQQPVTERRHAGGSARYRRRVQLAVGKGDTGEDVGGRHGG